MSTDIMNYARELAENAKTASEFLGITSGERKNGFLRRSAVEFRECAEELVSANMKDIEAAPGFGLSDAQVDRLHLTPQRIEEMSKGLEEVAMLPDPIGRVINSDVRPNGLNVQKIRVPLGVVFFIYESRPNVTADAAGICIKSGNAVILRGGKEAINSNLAIAEILKRTAKEFELPEHAVQVINTTDRAIVGALLGMPEYITVTIPRGGESLIRTVSEQAKMPVIKHFAGNCHVYIDRFADPDTAEKVLINSKCQRLGVCNAAESLVVHSEIADALLPRLAKSLADHGIEIRGDEKTCEIVSNAKPASEADYRTEFLAPVISVKIVDSLDAAIKWINSHSDGHTEAIITTDIDSAREFMGRIDSSAVMLNASTRFNDGGCFGLGAEIGISTDKFHARGPCGLEELTTYKYMVYGNGQIRE